MYGITSIVATGTEKSQCYCLQRQSAWNRILWLSSLRSRFLAEGDLHCALAFSISNLVKKKLRLVSMA